MDISNQKKSLTSLAVQMEASRCLYCFDAPCSQACPANVDVAGFIRRIKTANFRGAIELIRQANLLAEVCGYVCPTEALCEKACCRTGLDQPIAIAELQTYVARRQRLSGFRGSPHLAGTVGHRIAIIGAGPAGLGAAMHLLRQGYSVEVYDQHEFPGGSASYAIPPHKLEKKAVLYEAQLVQNAGAQFHMQTKIEDPTSLLDSFSAVVMGTGLGKPLDLRIEGEETPGVYTATEFLQDLCDADLKDQAPGLSLGVTVLVFGGGNTAIDCAVAARLLGADDVTIIYRRSRREMPAWSNEISRALHAGVKFAFQTQPVRFIEQGGCLNSIECIRTQLVALDETGRARPIPINDSEFRLTADNAIIALGNASHPWLAQHNDVAMSTPGIFVCGDMVSREGTVVGAVASGVAAAEAAHNYLSSATVPRVTS